MSDKDILRMLRENDARLSLTEAKEVARKNYGVTKPSSWPNNVPFFDATANMWVYYDGTRWLTIAEYYVPIVPRQAIAVTNTLLEQVIRTDYAPYITRTVTLTNVAAPNTAGNYWTVTISGINTARTAASNIETFNTSLDTAAVETLRDNVPGTSQIPTNRTLLRVIVQITAGAPGAITIAQALYFRLIIP